MWYQYLCVADSDRLEHQLEEAVTLRQDYESSASKLKTLEKQVKSLRQEKDEIHKVTERNTSVTLTRSH